MAAVVPTGGASGPPEKTRAARAARRKTNKRGDTLLDATRTNTTSNARAGKAFRLGLDSSGRIVHIYSRKDVPTGPTRIVMGPPKKGLRPRATVGGSVAPPVLGSSAPPAPAVPDRRSQAQAIQQMIQARQQARNASSLAATRARRRSRRANRASGAGQIPA